MDAILASGLVAVRIALVVAVLPVVIALFGVGAVRADLLCQQLPVPILVDDVLPVLCVGERVPVFCGIIVEQVFLTCGEGLAHHPSSQVMYGKEPSLIIKKCLK